MLDVILPGMLTIHDLKNKMVVLIEGVPYSILEVKHLHMGRGGSSVQTRIKNLATGRVFSRNFKPADSFAEADLERRELVYLYQHRSEYVFSATENPAERFSLSRENVGQAAQWLKQNSVVTVLSLDGKLLTITPPIKVDLKVAEAPPGFRGDTATGGTKTVTLETGAKIQVPLFVNEGDTIRVNTETGEYAERIQKA